MDRNRCRDERFFIDPSPHHEDILLSCHHLMSQRLSKNICCLDDYALLSEVRDLSARLKRYIGSSLEYACRFWTKHLAKAPCDGPHVGQILRTIDEFFKRHLLCWIEVLCITGHLGVAVYAMNDIRQWYILVRHTQMHPCTTHPYTPLPGRNHPKTGGRRRTSHPGAF